MIPIIAIFFGGLAKWILAGGVAIRDYFLVGIDLALTSLALSFINIFNWIRGAVAAQATESLEFLPLIFAGSIAFVSIVVLLFVIALMGAYVNKQEPEGQPSISWPWFWVINALGGIPLGISAALLIG